MFYIAEYSKKSTDKEIRALIFIFWKQFSYMITHSYIETNILLPAMELYAKVA